MMSDEEFYSIMVIIPVIIVFLLFIWLPAKMAKKRGRSVLGWILFFWIISPIFGIILLLILGDSKKKMCEDILKELKEFNKDNNCPLKQSTKRTC